MPNSSPAVRGHTALEERVNAHDREIAGIRRDIHAIGEKMDTLVSSIGAMRSTNWQAIWPAGTLAVTIIIAVGTLAWWPVVQSVGELKEAQLHQYRTEMTTFVPRVEIDVMRDAYDRELRFANERLADLSKRFGDTYTVKDALDDINKRIDRLQDIESAPALNRLNNVHKE